MGVFSAFSVALSALQAESSAIDTTGNNLANLNTTGFKGSNVDFRDMVSQAIGVGTSATSVGLGVMPPLNVQQFTQGSILASSSTLDCAIEGNGFFIVNNASGAQLFHERWNRTFIPEPIFDDALHAEDAPQFKRAQLPTESPLHGVIGGDDVIGNFGYARGSVVEDV